MAFEPLLKTTFKLAVQAAADSQGGMLQVQLGTPGSKVWITDLNKEVDTGQMWAENNPIGFMMDAGLDAVEQALIAAYGDPNP